MCYVTFSSLRLYFKEVSKNNRLTANIEALNTEAESFKTRAGQQASLIAAQEITISELRRVYPVLRSQLHNLYINPGRFLSATTTAQELRASIAAPILPATDPQPAQQLKPIEPRRFAWSDEWISITGTIYADTVKTEIAATDTIFVSTYKGERRKPWAWIFSPRKTETAATNANPYININVVQSATLKR